MSTDVIAPEVRRKNLVLGLILGGFALGLILIFMILFTKKGLPKDVDPHRQRSHEGRVGHPLGETEKTSTLPAAPIEASEEIEP